MYASVSVTPGHPRRPGARYVKRLYVRKFANNISLSMKDRLYQHLVQTPKRDMEQADTGA